MNLLLLLWAVLALFLSVYALGYYLFAALALTRAPAQPPSDGGDDAVVVLIPARQEGERAARALWSVLAQDHPGPIDAILLVKDTDDDTLPFLTRRYGVSVQAGAQPVVVHASGHRRLLVYLCGADPKHLKINRAIASVTAPWVAILDGDHEAHPAWIRTSLAVLAAEGGRLVQSRREPLEQPGLLGLWDSLHQHVGCEVSNIGWTRLGRTVFFTGTTAVMETALLRRFPLEPCLTEDTALSYRLILDGERLHYNPWSGSREAVSPNLYSFLARRRRWAHGHTAAFFQHLGGLWRAPIGLWGRVQYLFHGLHYGVAVAVLGAHTLLGLLLLPLYPAPIQVGAVITGLLVSLLVLRTQRGTVNLAWMLSAVVLGVWFTPAMLLLLNLTLAVVRVDAGWLALPTPNIVEWISLAGFVSPLLVLLVGLRVLGGSAPGRVLVVILSYPLAFYMDVAGVLLGLVDLLTGQQRWLKVDRAVRASSSRSVLLEAVATMKSAHLLPWAIVCALLGLGVFFLRPPPTIDAVARDCVLMEHDGHPWIVPPERLDDYCNPSEGPRRGGTLAGAFTAQPAETLTTLAPRWDRLEDTFPCNLAQFSSDNVTHREGALRLLLKAEPSGDRAYTAGSIATGTDPAALFHYGRFEVELRPTRGDGLLTAFFLYRFDPWQEIDMEFLGRDTTQVLLNVYYNPGEEGDLYNYGYRGTPVLIDLGFDAAADFHTYAIEWTPDELRWYVDGELIHVRPDGRPTPVPHLPMRFHINAWPICSEELAGAVDPSAFPAEVAVRSVRFSGWQPPLVDRLGGDAEGDWRQNAAWMQ